MRILALISILVISNAHAATVGVWIAPNSCIECINYPDIFNFFDKMNLPKKVYVDISFKSSQEYIKKGLGQFKNLEILYKKKLGNASFEQSAIFLLSPDSQIMASISPKLASPENLLYLYLKSADVFKN